MAPRVSVVMSAYNGERYVAEAIESILKQTFQDFEFVIIDDASTDRTGKLLAEYARKDKRIKILKNKKNLGLTKSLNKGLKAAKGTFIARMDADDISQPNRLKAQVTFLDKNPNIALVGSNARIISNEGKRIGNISQATSHADIYKNMVKACQFVHPSVMFRRKIIEDTGGYNESFFAQDYEFFARIVAKYKTANLPEELLEYRWDFLEGMCFTSGKKVERSALRTRWRMVTAYGWPIWHVIYFVRPLVSFVIPTSIKNYVLRILHN